VTELSCAKHCNICGGDQFQQGPNGRLSRRGQSPRCTRCTSLERHRQLRLVYASLDPAWLRELSVLQLSPDVGVDPAWFQSYEVSAYMGENHLDLENIDRPPGHYDLVICNHVLEHVANDRKGFAELMRITRESGLLQVTVPSPYTQESTIDWGYPREDAHGHYRGYGRDIVERFEDSVPGTALLEVETFDPVTGDGGYVYLFSRSTDLLNRLAPLYDDVRRFDTAAKRRANASAD